MSRQNAYFVIFYPFFFSFFFFFFDQNAYVGSVTSLFIFGSSQVDVKGDRSKIDETTVSRTDRQ